MGHFSALLGHFSHFVAELERLASQASLSLFLVRSPSVSEVGKQRRSYFALFLVALCCDAVQTATQKRLA